VGDVSEHFLRAEFACKCGCGKDAIDVMLMQVLERVRSHFCKPVLINSGNRCASYNKAEGGAPKSLHMQSKAADIVVLGVHPRTVYDTLDRWYVDEFGMGHYDSFTHIDVRNIKVRW